MIYGLSDRRKQKTKETLFQAFQPSVQNIFFCQRELMAHKKLTSPRGIGLNVNRLFIRKIALLMSMIIFGHPNIFILAKTFFLFPFLSCPHMFPLPITPEGDFQTAPLIIIYNQLIYNL